jgi:hypothetical protein
MNRYPKHPRLFVHSPNYRQAFQRLDEVLERTCAGSNFEKIQLMRLALFGDVIKLQQSGTVKIPK